MKINDKIVRLINHGLSGDLLSELDERQINSLYKRLVETKNENSEAVTTKSSIESTKYTGPEVSAMKSKGQGLKVNGEVLPTADGGLEVIKRTGTAGSETTENVDIEMMEKFESKAQQKYFWAKCNRSKGKEKEKWCKMADEFSMKTSKKDYKKMPEKIHPEKTVNVKKEQKENYLNMVGKSFNKNMQNKIADISPSLKFESDLEKRIESLIETHLSPKMTKRDLVKLVSETELAPEKERTKTPTKTPDKIKPKKDSPYKPKPGVKPAPKAEANEQSPTIAPPKPKTPTIKPKIDTPYRPKPGVKPAPKAGKENIPNWLSFKTMGIKLK